MYVLFMNFFDYNTTIKVLMNYIIIDKLLFMVLGNYLSFSKEILG